MPHFPLSTLYLIPTKISFFTLFLTSFFSLPNILEHLIFNKLTIPKMATSAPVLDPLLQPPPTEMAQQAYTAHSGHGSVGPVIGVLAVITILGAIAVMIGRLCSGRGIRGHAQYDFERWVETKCASCIDGRLDPPPRVVLEHRVTSESGDAARAPPPPPEERNEEANETHPHQQQATAST